MGRGSYDSTRATVTSRSYVGLDHRQIFSSALKTICNPKGVELRESRDSENHPNSIPIIIGLDMTGSMHRIPKMLITEDLNNIMMKLLEAHITDPQVMFMGIGDHECDQAPLQISQFESDDQKLDQWLKDLWIERGGGGNDGESYLLSWYFAAHKTALDSIERRNMKGFLFTIGDEKTLKLLPAEAIEDIFDDKNQPITAARLYADVSEKYNVFHIHIREGSNGRRQEVIDDWRELIGDNLIIVEDHTEVAQAIYNAILDNIPVGASSTSTVGGANIIITE